jgi:FixJ family two-component response regulator
VAKTHPLIAVVDDEESICKALTRLMHSAGLSVETFSSGAEFLKSIDGHVPDCVVLDLHMPQVSGFAVQAHLARIHADVPIIFITGHDSPEARTRAMERGASAYLRKPVDDRALLDAISAAVTHRDGGAIGTEP